MKKAIGYIRISSKDQSNWSLEGQADDIRRHCQREQLELIASFVDDGQSAKNFDRASWKELENFVKLHHREIDYLIVMAYDRFSRNVMESLAWIQKLEQKYRILIISVTQPIPMHPDNPYYFKFRTDMLVNAEMELRVIRDRAKTGIYRASKDGRFTRLAPVGYKNARDERNKPILVIDEDKRHHIENIFRLYLQGSSFHDIEQAVEKKGFPIRSNGRIQRILSNPIYGGFIQVPEYYGEPEHLVKGLHQPIIDEATWWKAQALMQKPKYTQTRMSDDLPLRGVLHCTCGKALTGAASKGKSKYYNYYWCVDHRKQNYNADKVHAQLDALIKELALPSHYLSFLQEQALKEMGSALEENVREAERLKKERKEVQRNIDALEQRYIFDGLPKATYDKYRIPLENQRIAIESRLAEASGSTSDSWKHYHENLHLLSDIHFYYQSATTEGKQAFIRMVFEQNLQYDKGTLRTPKLPRLFSWKAASLQQKGLIVIDQPSSNFDDHSHLCGRGDATRTLYYDLIDWAIKYRRA